MEQRRSGKRRKQSGEDAIVVIVGLSQKKRGCNESSSGKLLSTYYVIFFIYLFVFLFLFL